MGAMDIHAKFFWEIFGKILRPPISKKIFLGNFWV
jgi:hypothetical protein